MVIKLTSDKRGAELVVRLEVTKANDVAFPSPMTLVYTFDDYGLKTARLARPGEYDNLEPAPTSAVDAVYQWLMHEAGKGTATQAAAATGFTRGTISRLFDKDSRFVRVERVGRETYYAARTRHDE